MLSPKLETERLILRRLEESDLDAMYEIISDNRLADYIQFPRLIKEADVSAEEKWIIELKENHEPIGNISVNDVNKRNNFCTIGYVVRYEYWGNGYATEALKTVSDYLLNERKYHLVEGVCNERNLSSSRVLIKAGFKKDGYVANRRLNKDGTYSGIEYYSKIK